MDERPRFRQATPREGSRPQADPRDASRRDASRRDASRRDEGPRLTDQRYANATLAPIPEQHERPFAPLLRRSAGRRWFAPFPLGVAVALVGSGIFIVIGIIHRASDQIPILCAGLAVFGLTLAAVAVACVITVVRAARDGRDARAFWAALAGGVATLGAAGALSSAYILALLWSSAKA